MHDDEEETRDLRLEGGRHWASMIEIYLTPKIGIFKKIGAKTLNFFTFTIGCEQ